MLGDVSTSIITHNNLCKCVITKQGLQRYLHPSGLCVVSCLLHYPSEYPNALQACHDWQLSLIVQVPVAGFTSSSSQVFAPNWMAITLMIWERVAIEAARALYLLLLGLPFSKKSAHWHLHLLPHPHHHHHHQLKPNTCKCYSSGWKKAGTTLQSTIRYLLRFP